MKSIFEIIKKDEKLKKFNEKLTIKEYCEECKTELMTNERFICDDCGGFE